MDRYIEKNGKKMRYGYTTGSCAAAAAKAATIALYKNEKPAYMKIDTPKGWVIDIEINYISSESHMATCGVVKDAGDDPDVTNGIQVFASVMKSDLPGVVIEGGLGVGRVTKKGLRVPVGDAAINPVPLKMIEQEVMSVLPEGAGVTVVIFVPEGMEVAKRTFNSRLGIIGGISILGTSGIVEPMSEDAFKDSLKIELSVIAATGVKEVIFIFGNFGRDYLGEGYPETLMQKTSNFVDYLLKAAAELGIKKILYVGHAGKMVKVASGMTNTHSKYGDGRMASMLVSAKPYIDEAAQSELLHANTTDEATGMLKDAGVSQEVYRDIALRCQKHCEVMAGGQVDVECIIFSTLYGELARTDGAIALLKKFKENKG